MAHPVEDPYRFTLIEYTLCAVAAIIAAPFVWAFSVLFLTALA